MNHSYRWFLWSPWFLWTLLKTPFPIHFLSFLLQIQQRILLHPIHQHFKVHVNAGGSIDAPGVPHPRDLLAGLLVDVLITQFIDDVGTPPLQLPAVAQAVVVAVDFQVVVVPTIVAAVPRLTAGA
jgi:hypothetical protein